jgi:hypothetical protein
MDTAREAIEKFCRRCQPEEAPADCTARRCALWPYRAGKKPLPADQLVRVIRRFCKACSGGEPAKCPSTICPLRGYRSPAAEAAAMTAR